MITSCYPKYKFSGLNRIGDIPEHWEIKKLRFIGRFFSSGIDKKIIEGEPLVKMINYTDIYGNSSLRLEKDREYMVVSCPIWKKVTCQVSIGDLIFTPSSETKDEIGYSALVDEDLSNTVFSYHVLRFIFSQNIEHEFKKYLCNNSYVLSQFTEKSQGTTRQILDRNDFNSTFVILPPFHEQHAISSFLDYKTTEIDNLIAEKKKLLTLLEEKRIAIIIQSVTKGLDPSVKMKHSGAGWLGEIPIHWDFKKLKYLVKMKSGEFINADQIEPEGDYAVMGGNGLRGYTDTYTHQGEFILIGRQGALCGNINIGKGKFYATEHAIVLKPIGDINIDWLSNLLEVMNLNQYSMTAAQPGLSVDFIKNLLVPVPSNEEQLVIGELIRCETLKIKKLQNEIRTAIKILLEYRTSMITSAITGKIDVRTFIEEQEYEEKIY